MTTLAVTVALTGTAAAAAPLPASERPATGPGTAPPTGSGPAAFGAPLTGPPSVVRDFDPPETEFGPGHRGVDLALRPGSPVRAAGDGVVVHAGPLAGRGVVSVEHPSGLRTTYEPVRAEVSEGDRVTRGQRIGTVAPSHPECVAGPGLACLHWGAKRDDEYLDPLRLLGLGTVRLLPWTPPARQPISGGTR